MAALRIRDWIALIGLTAGVILAFEAGNWVASLALVVSGMAFALTVVDINRALDEMSLAKMLAGSAAALGLVGFIISGGFLNTDRSKLNLEVQDLFMEASLGMYGPIDDRALQIAKAGFRLCATQHYTDAADLALAAGSAVYMPNSASLAAGVWEAANSGGQRADCMSAYRAFRELAPELVVGIERRYGNSMRRP